MSVTGPYTESRSDRAFFIGDSSNAAEAMVLLLVLANFSVGVRIAVAATNVAAACPRRFDREIPARATVDEIFTRRVADICNNSIAINNMWYYLSCSYLVPIFYHQQLFLIQLLMVPDA